MTGNLNKESNSPESTNGKRTKLAGRTGHRNDAITLKCLEEFQMRIPPEIFWDNDHYAIGFP
jgi:hypothetical protein